MPCTWRTRRAASVGTAVIVVPLHHPLVYAEEATVDLLGRRALDVGLGRGYQRYEFERSTWPRAGRAGWRRSTSSGLSETFTIRRTSRFPETTVFPSLCRSPPLLTGPRPEPRFHRDHRRASAVISCPAAWRVPSSGCAEFRRIFDTHMAASPRSTRSAWAPSAPSTSPTTTPTPAPPPQQACWNMRVTLSLRSLRARRARPRPARAPS